jgi:lantibiotic modifying enzyme
MEQIGAAYEQLTAQAHASLERSLLQQLTQLCAPALEWEFSLSRAVRQSSVSRLLGRLQENPTRQRYTTFVQELLAGRLLYFFREYSVLARLVGTTMAFWVAANGEFLSRLSTDRNDLQALFLGKGELGQVMEIWPDLSDRHNQGRAVMMVRFAGGL